MKTKTILLILITLFEFDILFASYEGLEVRISTIVVQTKEIADSVYLKLENGEDFADLAIGYSIGPGRDKGGDLGYIPYKDLMPEIQEALNNLEINQHSNLITTSSGYLIVKKTDERTIGNDNFKINHIIKYISLIVIIIIIAVLFILNTKKGRLKRNFKNESVTSGFVSYDIYSKEHVYYILRILFTFSFYILFFYLLFNINYKKEQIFVVIPLFIYLLAFILYFFFRKGLLIGYIKGNAVRLTEKQFSDIFKIVKQQSERLGLNGIPSVYILQSGGLLNAFATRFVGNNYIVLYSEFVETILKKDNKALEFVIGHELGHIKRKHMSKSFWLFPSFLIPFLNPAYSRACEYTCDNIGHALSSDGAESGILVLAAGKNLFNHVNVKDFIDYSYQDLGFWRWFAEIVSSHPNLKKRLKKIIEKQNTKQLST